MVAERCRVISSDTTARISLAHHEDPDEDGCFLINWSDLDVAQSHGFMLWRPHMKVEKQPEAIVEDSKPDDAGAEVQPRFKRKVK